MNREKFLQFVMDYLRTKPGEPTTDEIFIIDHFRIVGEWSIPYLANSFLVYIQQQSDWPYQGTETSLREWVDGFIDHNFGRYCE